LKIAWKRAAQEDRLRIFDYLAERNPTAALDIDELFSLKVTQLSEHPKLHRAGRIKGTREAVVHHNYILVYQVQIDEVIILRVLHSAQYRD
jgi:addiction module RelE/StbE family toxin